MWTDFFRKNVKKLVVILCSCGAFLLAVIGVRYAFNSQYSVQTVALGSDFYFLVSTDQRVEVSTQFVRLEGGAGYLIAQDGEEYVAYAVYTEKTDGEKVKDALNETKARSKLLRLKVDALRLKKGENAVLYQNAFNALYGEIGALNACIFRLEKGMTQENCKRLLEGFKNRFVYLAKEYKSVFPAFAKVCEQASFDLQDISNGIVYATDLRYSACCLSEEYIRLSSSLA